MTAVGVPLKFASVGIVNTALGLLVIQCGLWAGLGDYAANAIGYAAGLVCSYILNRSYTFAGTGPNHKCLVLFLVAAGLAYLANLCVIWVSAHLGLSGTIVTHIAALTVYSVVFYLLLKHAVFATGNGNESDADRAWTRLVRGLREVINRWPAIFAIAALATVPVLMVRTVPLIDLGGHIGRYAVQVDAGASPVLRQWYSFSWGLLPNLGCDVLVQLLHPVLDLERSVRLIVAAIVALHVAGVLMLSRAAHGSVTGTSLFALPLAYGLPFQYGFVNFTLSIGFALCSLAAWIALGDQGRIALRAMLFLPIGVAIWTCHLAGYGLFVIAAGAVELVRARAERRGWIDAAGRIAVIMAPLMAGPIIGVLAPHGPGPAEAFAYARLSDKFAWFQMAFFDKWEAWDLGSICLVMGMAYWAWRSPLFVRHAGLALAAGLLLLLYVIMPDRIMGSALADMRLVPAIITLFLVAAAPGPGSSATLRGWLIVAGLAFAGARLAGNGVAMVIHERYFARSLEVLDAVPRDTNLLTFHVRKCGQDDGWSFDRRTSLSGYALVRRHAFDNNQWQMPGGQLIRVHNLAAAPFEHAPNPLTANHTCFPAVGLDQEIARVGPQVGYLWIIGYPGTIASHAWAPVRISGDSQILARQPGPTVR